MTSFKKYLGAILLAASTQAMAVPTLSVSTNGPATVGTTVDLAVMISDISDLYGYQFTVSYNVGLLKANGVTEGAFLGTAGTTFSDGGTIDNTSGTISFVFNTLTGPIPGASGNGALAHLSFDTLGIGSAAFSFSDLIFLDASLNDIAVSVADSSLDIVDAAAGVPEPAGYLLLGAGLIAAGAARRRQGASRV